MDFSKLFRKATVKVDPIFLFRNPYFGVKLRSHQFINFSLERNRPIQVYIVVDIDRLAHIIKDLDITGV